MKITLTIAAVLLLCGAARADALPPKISVAAMPDCPAGFSKLAQSPELYQGKYRVEFACKTPVIKCAGGADVQAGATSPAANMFEFTYKCPAAVKAIVPHQPCVAGFTQRPNMPSRPPAPPPQLVCTARVGCPGGTIVRPWTPYLLLDLPHELEAMYVCMKMG